MGGEKEACNNCDEGARLVKNQKNSAKALFAAGMLLILLSPFYASLIMRTIYIHEANFLVLRFLSSQISLQLVGLLLAAAGLIERFRGSRD